MEAQPIERSYTPSLTGEKFHNSNAPFRILVGPFASGKSTMCVMEIITRSAEQQRGPDGFRRTRWAVIRNTYGELQTTTTKTWLQWAPEGVWGEMVHGAPMVYTFSNGDVRAEIIFVSLDKEEHVRKLLSMELTGAWVNEAREIRKPIIDALDGRVGRYPSMADGGPTWSGIILDTNPPDVDHWIPEIESLCETMRKGESAAKERVKLRLVSDDPNEVDDTDEIDPTTIHPDDYLILHQPSGLSPMAENLNNLKGGADYYKRLARGKTKEYVAVYVKGEYGSAKEGMPIYPEFMASKIVGDAVIPWHVADGPLTPNKKLPLWLAFDYGLTPCATICQYLPTGQVAVLEEVISTKINPSGMGIKTFGKYVKQFVLANKYAGYKVHSYGDPAGADPSQTDEKSCQDMLREIGLPTKAAPTNLFSPRRQGVADFLGTPEDRYPGMIIDPSCVVLIEGFKRAYKYKAVKVAGEERFKYEADKVHPVSDVHDSLQYNCGSMRKDLHLQKRRPMGGDNKPRQVMDQTVGY